MNHTRVKALRNQITEADIIHTMSYLLEGGKTAADSFSKMSRPCQEMCIASLVVYAETRTAQRDRPPIASNLRRERVARRWSLEMALKALHAAAPALPWSIDIVCRMEEGPLPREKMRAGMAEAFEQVYGRGWEYLSARVSKQQSVT